MISLAPGLLELGGFFPLHYFIFYVYGLFLDYHDGSVASKRAGSCGGGSPLTYPSSSHAPFRYEDIYRSGSSSGTDDFTESPRCSSFGGYRATPF